MAKALALEDLTNICKNAKKPKFTKDKTTVTDEKMVVLKSKKVRTEINFWSFSQLGRFIKYKAEGLGIPVYVINPSYTSQTCSICGCIDKANRINQSDFICVSCGHISNADINAAKNISKRAEQSISLSLQPG